jgi:hypothetical protein
LNHCINNYRWREGGTFGSSHGRRPKLTKRFAQWILPRFDPFSYVCNDRFRNLRGTTGKSFLFFGPSCDRARAKRECNRYKCSLRIKVGALASDD